MPVARIIVVKDGKSCAIDLITGEILHQSFTHFTEEELDALLRPLLLQYLKIEKADAAKHS